jgi:hypothetical protein
MPPNEFALAKQVVKEQYKELMHEGLPFLQIFPEMIQEANIAETFKRRGTGRNKSIMQSELDERAKNVEEFRENLFLYCGVNLSIFKLPVQTQAAFWFMLFNWIECNNYSITIGPEKRKILAKYYSRSDDPNSRSVQNIFRGLTNCGLLVRCRKNDLICKNNTTYEVTYRVPFIVSQQRVNQSFIKLNEEIIQLKMELKIRSEDYMKKKYANNEPEGIEIAVTDVLKSVMGKISKRNMDALVKVNFSAKIDFSAESGIKIKEIEHIQSIDSLKEQTLDSYNTSQASAPELNEIFDCLRLTKKQKELLNLHFLSLKETYFFEGEKTFNCQYADIKGLGRTTKKVLIASFKSTSD